MPVMFSAFDSSQDLETKSHCLSAAVALQSVSRLRE